MATTAIYPGTFDPLTYGHVDLITRAAKIFDRTVVAVAQSSNKTPIFSLAKRVSLAEAVLSSQLNIEVCGFDDLLVTFARRKNAQFILRGLRVVTDFDYELPLNWINKKLAPELETLFLIPAEEYAYISSSLVKEIAKLGGNVSNFVPSLITTALNEYYQK